MMSSTFSCASDFSLVVISRWSRMFHFVLSFCHLWTSMSTPFYRSWYLSGNTLWTRTRSLRLSSANTTKNSMAECEGGKKTTDLPASSTTTPMMFVVVRLYAWSQSSKHPFRIICLLACLNDLSDSGDYFYNDAKRRVNVWDWRYASHKGQMVELLTLAQTRCSIVLACHGSCIGYRGPSVIGSIQMCFSMLLWVHAYLSVTFTSLHNRKCLCRLIHR